jgi:hypothetical protein
VIKVRRARSLTRGHGATQQRGGIAGQSVTATLKLFQERGETFRDRLVDGIVPGPEPLPNFPQPWPFGPECRDVRTGSTYAARAAYYRLVRLAGCSRVRSTPEHEVSTSAQNVYETLRDK